MTKTEYMGIDNRKHIEIDGTSWTVIPIIPFEEWIQMRYGNWDKFNTLPRKDKEKLFLRWKWGFTDERANESLELSEKATLFQFKDSDLSDLSDAWRFHIQNKRDFDRICYETKKRIGLIFKSNPLVDKIIDTFDAQEA